MIRRPFWHESLFDEFRTIAKICHDRTVLETYILFPPSTTLFSRTFFCHRFVLSTVDHVCSISLLGKRQPPYNSFGSELYIKWKALKARTWPIVVRDGSRFSPFLRKKWCQRVPDLNPIVQHLLANQFFLIFRFFCFLHLSFVFANFFCFISLFPPYFFFRFSSDWKGLNNINSQALGILSEIASSNNLAVESRLEQMRKKINNKLENASTKQLIFRCIVVAGVKKRGKKTACVFLCYFRLNDCLSKTATTVWIIVFHLSTC